MKSILMNCLWSESQSWSAGEPESKYLEWSWPGFESWSEDRCGSLSWTEEWIYASYIN